MTHTPGIMGLSGTRYRMNSAEWQNLSIGDQFIAAVGIDPRGLEGLSDGIRLRDCWNACDGIADPSVVPELLNQAERLAQAYVLVCDQTGKPYYESVSSVYAHLMAAIAKAKGETA